MRVMDQCLPPFQVFLEDHLDPVRAFLRGMVGPTDADDCLQETFIAALRAYPRAHAGNLRAWVFTIARRKAIDHQRSRSRRAQPVAVAELPPGQRAAVVLRFAVDLRYRDVGEALGTSEEGARRNVHEGLKKLRRSAAELKEMTT